MGNIEMIREEEKIKLKNMFLEAIDDLPESMSLSTQMFVIALNELVNYELPENDLYEFLDILTKYNQGIDKFIKETVNENMPVSTIYS